MRYSAEAAANLNALVDAAENEPVFIDRGDHAVAVLLSARDFDRITGAANKDLQAFCDSVSDKAIARGLTEEELNQLLNHA